MHGANVKIMHIIYTICLMWHTHKHTNTADSRHQQRTRVSGGFILAIGFVTKIL